MKWREASDYTQYKLVLCGSADNPTESTNAANRKNRPPTSQQFLDEYTSSLTPLHNENTTAQLLVCFAMRKSKVLNYYTQFQAITMDRPLFTISISKPRGAG